MSDEDDRFAPLEDLDKSDNEEPAEPDDEDPSERSAPTAEEQTRTESEESTDSGEVSLEDPAFSYAESNQGPIYARPSTWDTYDDTLELEVERYLREQNIRNAQKRELHDAALRLAAKRPEELAELLIDARREK